MKLERYFSAKMVKGYIFIIISAFIFGCQPLGAKFLYEEGVNSFSLVFLRNFLAIPILGFLTKLQGHSLKIDNNFFREISIIAIMGGCLTPILLFSSYNYLETGTATILHFTYPAMVVLGGCIFLHEKICGDVMVCVLVCSMGISLFYNPTKPINMHGSILALLSGATYAAYVLLLSKCKQKQISGFKLNFYVALICSFIMLLIGLISKQLVFPTSFEGWIISVLFSLFMCVIAGVLFQKGTFLIGGQRAAILSTVEPITSILVGFLVFQEVMEMRTAIGAFLVILASILIAFFDMLSLKE